MNDGEAILLLTEALERHYNNPVRVLDVHYFMLQGCQRQVLPDEIRKVIDPKRHDPSTIVGILDWLRRQGWLKQTGSAYSLTIGGKKKALDVRRRHSYTSLEFSRLASRLAA